MYVFGCIYSVSASVMAAVVVSDKKKVGKSNCRHQNLRISKSYSMNPNQNLVCVTYD